MRPFGGSMMIELRGLERVIGNLLDNARHHAPGAETTVTASKEQQEFQGKVDEAFKALGDAIKVFLPKANDFEAGKIAPADFKGNVDLALPEFVKSRDAVAALEK